MRIVQDYISPGRANRPMTNPSSSLYRKVMQPKYITIHNAYSRADAKTLHAYVKSTSAASRPASWHFSIDEKECYQALPTNEVGWHAGDNLGPGNTTTIGIEICDFAMLLSPRNEPLFMQAVDHAAKLCAHLIKTEPTLLPYPQCLKQHYDWSGKNCPSWIRAQPNGWRNFVDRVGEYIKGQDSWPAYPIPKIQRSVGVELNGQRTNEVAYLIDGNTYIRALFIMEQTGSKVTGHGDHIRIATRQK